MADNWNEYANKTVYTHKANPLMVVKIIASNDPKNAKYFVYHTHPGYGGIIIPQKMERAMTLTHARKLVEPHLKHWNDANKWTSDPDFGKAN